MTIAAGAQAAPVVRASDHAGTIYLGAIADNDWGRPIGSGDLDGDGYDEVIVSASESFGGLISRVYIMRGGPDARFQGSVDLSTTGVDQVILGVAPDDNLGATVATGDVNGDGIDDLLICASLAHFGARTYAGLAYLIYGSPTFFASATRDLSVAGSWDLRIAGPIAGGDMGGAGSFGGQDTHAAAIGNLNGDALGDIAIGVHLAEGDTGIEDAGRVYIILGKAFVPGSTLDLALSTDHDVRIYGEGRFDETGDLVLLGDLTGDGIDELIIPNHYFSQVLFDSEGAVHIYRGRTSWPSTLTLRTAPADITLLGYRFYDELGESAAVGDFNGDGVMDLAAAATGADFGAFNDQRGDGLVYGLLGTNGLQTGTHLIDYAVAVPDFLLVGEFEENLGMTMTAGDYNGDGIDDIAAAEWFAGPQTNGVVEVLFGRAFAGSPTYFAAVDTDVHILGGPSDRIGFSLWSADVDGDGVEEPVYGTPFNNGAFPDTYGTVYAHSLLDGDYDGSGGLDLRDFARFQECYTTPGPPSANGVCYVFDMWANQQLDEADVVRFVERLTGP
jgi:hypothetical protein